MQRELPDLIDPEWTDEYVQEIYGDDSDEILAFRKFLKLPRNEAGQVECPQHWYDWGMGRLGAAEVLKIDAAVQAALAQPEQEE